MVSAASGSLQIFDYSSSSLIAIKLGNVRLTDGNFKIIHFINITDYEYCLDRINQILTRFSEFKKDDSYNNLNFLLKKINNRLSNIKPREKRSLDFLGSTWKWIAGSPDHHDLNIITEKINNVLENNNHQVVINKNLIDRINKISQIQNEIVTKSRSITNTIPDLYFELQFIDNEIENILYAIHWSKQNIINPVILDQHEIKEALSQINKNNLPYTTIENAFNFASIKIASDKKQNLLYIISIPITTEETYDLIELRSNYALKATPSIEHNQIIRNKENHETFIFKKNFEKSCENIEGLNICKISSLNNISNNLCLLKIMAGRNSSCNHTNKQHLSEIEELHEGIILLNNFKGIIRDTCDGDVNNFKNNTRQLTGTFLIKFYNCTIDVNGQMFQSKVIKEYQIIPQMFHTLLQGNINRSLTMEYLHDLNIQNTKYISKMENLTHFNLWNTISINIIMISIIITVIIIKMRRTTSTKIINQIPSTRDDSILKGEKLSNNPHPTISTFPSNFP
jgi:hypothetical protein